MKTVRGVLALAGVGALAACVLGGTPAFAAPLVNDPTIPDVTAHAEYDTGAAAPSVVVDVYDPASHTVIATGMTDMSGDVVIEDVADTGGVDYLVVARGAGAFADATALGPLSGDLSTWDIVDPLVLYSDVVVLSGTVRHGETGLPFSGAWIVAESITSPDFYPDYTPTDMLGHYSFIVPRGEVYQLLAESPLDDNYPQYWDHAPLDVLGIGGGGCGCGYGFGDEIDATASAPAGTTPAGPFDFDLRSIDDNFVIEVVAGDIDTSGFIPGIDMELRQKQPDGSWLVVDQRTTNADGMADLFANGVGDYRLHYSIAGVFYSADVAVSFSGTIGGGGIASPLPLGPDGCYVELGTLTPVVTPPPPTGSGDLLLVLFEGSHLQPCGPSAPPSTPGPRSHPGATGAVVFSTPATPTPTPTPTPTSTPSPSSSQSSSPSASPTPMPEPASVSDTGFPWWIVLVIVLAIGIVVTIILVLRRR
ncbi:MAG: hypothetical protein KF727_01345 [Microbacteriaceae bacterium]|nr:hypothetical protein [Microbacteriaceae bacterium]